MTMSETITPTLSMIRAALSRAEAFASEYEFESDEGCHILSDLERLLMLDMLNGLFDDEAFVAALSAQASTSVAGAVKADDGVASWNDVPSAPKDGTMLRLLVVPDEESHTSFHDSETPYETIGFNQMADTGDDEWQFAGWDWSHDCITQGYGEVIGWLPFALTTRDATEQVTITDEMVERALASWFGDDWPLMGGLARTGVDDDMRAALRAALTGVK